MNKFQSQLSNVWKWFSVTTPTVAVISVIIIIAIHFIKIPMIESWESSVIEEPTIKIMYVTGNGVQVHDGPSEAHAATNAFNWCKSLIVFSTDREWIEIGNIEPMGWMHEGFLTDKKPDRCK